jgi:hypothetical protein
MGVLFGSLAFTADFCANSQYSSLGDHSGLLLQLKDSLQFKEVHCRHYFASSFDDAIDQSSIVNINSIDCLGWMWVDVGCG